MQEIIDLVNQYGVPTVVAVGMAYFIYYIWWFVGEKLEPEIEKQHIALIRVIDQVRMLDQDLIRLQEKVNVVLEYRERQKIIDDQNNILALEEQNEREKKDFYK